MNDVAQDGIRRNAFAALSGLFFFVVIIKLGDPVIIDTAGLAPGSLGDAIAGVWPNDWGYWMLAPMIAGGLALMTWKRVRTPWLVALPAAWLLWQFVAATHTVDARLTTLTLRHFSACVALFYLGYFGLNGVRRPLFLYAGLALALCWVLRAGMEQHFGGLADTRKYIIHTVYGDGWPTMAAQNPDFAKRIESDRIFATFVYPNALGGGLLLLLPMSLVLVWELTAKLPLVGRLALVGVFGACGMAELVWSGSKAGWLLALVLGVIVMVHSGLPRRWVWSLAALIVAGGLVGFAFRFSHYFERGATSVSARFDYWKAAGQTIKSHPVFGTGPGTFSRPYARLKDPKSEMARLCHNDYLEQGSDSGVLGMILFFWFIFWSVLQLYRYRIGKNLRKERLLGASVLGVIGLCLHSFVEYHLYIPALSWPLFFLLGWLLSLE